MINDLGNMLVLRVNELLVLCVNKRDKEGNRGREESEAPAWQELEEIVADQGSQESLHWSVLSSFAMLSVLLTAAVVGMCSAKTIL